MVSSSLIIVLISSFGMVEYNYFNIWNWLKEFIKIRLIAVG
jgi:hypothetical protein